MEPTAKGTTTDAMIKEAKRSRPIDLPRGPGSIGRHRGLHPGVGNEGIVHGRDPLVSLIPGQGLVSGSALRNAIGRGRPTQNRHVCHFSFPGRWKPKPYLVHRLSRPLPRQVLTPEAVAAAIAIMPHRPSTSAGPGSFRSASSRSLHDKRQSKDDMLLPVDGRIGTGRPTQGMHPYMMGMRGGNLPTPEASPDQAAASSMSSFLAPATQPMTGHESFITSMEVPIGMALGSPSQFSEIQNQPSSWQPQSGTPPWRTPSPPPPPPAAAPQMVPQAAPPAPPPLQRRKTTRQRIFGALFGRGKQSDSAKAADLISANSSAVSLSTTGGGREPAGNAVPSRSNTISGRKGPRHVPILVRSNTDLPITTTAPVEPRQWEQPPPPPPLMPPASSWNDLSRSVTPSSLANSSAPSLLDVEIPSIKMERYSVMFSGVLNPQQQKQQRRKSNMTLLERRQATLEKLKSINDRVVAECEEEVKQLRRASSPQPTQSPGFSILPPTPSRQQLDVPPTPRSRSNSSPAVIPSPTVEMFSEYMQPLEAPPTRREKKRVTIISLRTMEEQNRANQIQGMLEEQEQQHTQNFHEAQPQQEDEPEYLPGEEVLSVSPRRPEAWEEQQQPQPKPEQAFPPRKDSHFAPEKSFLVLDTPLSPPEQLLNVSSSRQAEDPEIVGPFLLKPTVYQPPEPRLVVPSPPSRSPPSPPQPSLPEITSPPILSPKSPTLPSTCSPAFLTHKGHTLSPSVDLAAAAEEETEEADPIIKAAVEISVARTISISRRAGAQQKRVESSASSRAASPQQQRSPSQPPTHSRSERPPPVPLARSASVSAGSLQRSRSVKASQITITRAGTLKVRRPGAEAGEPTLMTTNDLGRVAETKQATPTLVVPPPAEFLINSPCSALSTPGLTTPGTAGSELPKEVLARYRKSERVVIGDTTELSDSGSDGSDGSESGREGKGEAEDQNRGRDQFKRPPGFAEARYVRA
ncbi:hypothetical protein SMACR_00957 [Sordaria macrospora]|uniref:WGS project CABT00000000 data, contig 2.2 n=2 Tax=Sordaria macrospora TaxID=5147 RepID=F7VNK4_SORMK|nr:uncharacterized protein SMAC_00957 [Sordaria macrospora k-hell]KAA8632704.1 hypothetical protein SMACR_00957 [Sordaria macrospora]WPJ62201.1 hypothetical protein SMAC4_00957 [Sordaria macrospora]CCC06933.1 unnamed protein product [Sordaria macrospora k-hell]